MGERGKWTENGRKYGEKSLKSASEGKEGE